MAIFAAMISGYRPHLECRSAVLVLLSDFPNITACSKVSVPLHVGISARQCLTTSALIIAHDGKSFVRHKA